MIEKSHIDLQTYKKNQKYAKKNPKSSAFGYDY
jgi:hypothetical protein